MKKYPLGHAVIEWDSGGYSEALFYQDAEGKQFFVCSNWISGPVAVEKYANNFSNIISDHDDIYMFLNEQEN
ncbi:hypothetical protein AVV36_gp154 [Pectobacterium bacteriophage PM2]|uniref:Uncharacterized protein n=1 Tax=Pectobacterium bacteriophage PM2 TaxID=1429794 RepID=A0A0A0Q0H3_9CAUD|nr:hypothetical protein AVV36_gp154 [Pectobacterium bacteriophage PM2]AHY25116.1 hypothetical protein PM2_154 [Pectobacterium bacteriophage PM2]